MELQILDTIQNIHSPLLDNVMVMISSLGNAGLLWILLALILLAMPKTRTSGVILCAALLVDVVVCNGLLKNLLQRPRPCDINTTVQLLVDRPTDYSFPSGHTAAAFASVCGLYLGHMKKLWKPALVLAILIGFSRLYLYVHYPTDVIGGMVVGLACGWLGCQLVKPWLNRSEKSERAANESGSGTNFLQTNR